MTHTPTEQIVYAAGGITGLTYTEATDWRAKVQALLDPHIRVASPMRAKSYLAQATNLSAVGYPEKVLSTPKGIVTRDHNDVHRCHAMLAYLLDTQASPRVSIGTMIEFGWASAYKKPIVAVLTDKSLHWHCMVTELAGFIVPTIEEAAHILNNLLRTGI